MAGNQLPLVKHPGSEPRSGNNKASNREKQCSQIVKQPQQNPTKKENARGLAMARTRQEPRPIEAGRVRKEGFAVSEAFLADNGEDKVKF